MTLLVIGALSEMLILHWLLLVTKRPAPGALAWALGTPVLGLANFLALYVVRAFSRKVKPVYYAGRLFMIGTLGAMLTGPLLAAAFALLVLPARLFDALTGTPGLGEVALVGGGGAAIALGFGSILWGFLVGQRRLRIERVDLHVRDLPAALEGLSIAHVSDLHIGHQLHGERLRAMLERVNALEPDLIAITGDIFDFDPGYVEEGCRALAKLTARHGVFAILGNHDVYTGAETVAAGLAELTPIRLLRGEFSRLEIDGAPLYVAGVDDPGRGWTERDAEHSEIERLGSQLPDDGPRILLVHRPSFFAQAARVGFPIVLCGHTHGGQIGLPPPGQHHNLSRLISHWTRGHFENGESVLYVSRGLGTVGPPVRLNCPREIALLRLVPRPRT